MGFVVDPAVVAAYFDHTRAAGTTGINLEQFGDFVKKYSATSGTDKNGVLGAFESLLKGASVITEAETVALFSENPDVVQALRAFPVGDSSNTFDYRAYVDSLFN